MVSWLLLDHGKKTGALINPHFLSRIIFSKKKSGSAESENGNKQERRTSSTPPERI